MNSPIPSLPIVLAALFPILLPHLAAGQESVPLEQAQKGAQLLAEAAGRIADAAVTVDANLEKPFAVKGGSVALLVIPDKALTAEKLGGVGTTMTPVGQLWMTEVNVAVNGHSPAKDNLRFYNVKAGDNDMRVQLYLVGAIKNAAGQVELVVYGQGREPLVHVPLEKSSAGAKEMPIEFAGRKNDETSGTLTLFLPGQYQAEILLVKAE